MRLLSLNGHGNLACAEFTQDRLPPYAILSHTWGAEEVTFADLTSGKAQKKAGYRKIEFCGEQAARDKLQYFWVDSCCINKESSAELTEAINSMFRWYRGAVKCYVHLSDVSASASNARQIAWEAALRASKWFTRGWTLQELLAPTCVEFYSCQHQRLGDKESLCPLIHDITRIPVEALRGEPLNTFSREERMTWAAGRQTTKDEDGAYCLLGLFDIFMPLIYGEGKDSALRRLQRELDGLPTTTGTCFTVPFERNPRFTGREPLLADLESRLFVGEQTTKIAVVGLGGIGKTQIALEVAYKTRNKYMNCSVFWIPAIDMDSLHKAYRDVARQLHIPGWDDEKADVKRLVQVHLSQESTRPWLCIFDNADDIGMWIQSGSDAGSGSLKEYLPKSKQGCVVFTTRDKKAAVKLAGCDIIEVPELDEDRAVQLLRKSLADSSLQCGQEQDARILVRELTCLPLAIVQAAAYISENTTMFKDYFGLLNEQEGDVIELLSEDFEDDWRYQSIKNPVAVTWLISFERIRRQEPLAAEYLSFMACIDRKDIPQSLLPAGMSRKKETDAIGTLKAYSFIVQRSETAVFDLHRLVHLVTRSWLRREGTLAQWSQTAIERLDEIFPVDQDQGRLCGMLFSHAAYVLKSNVAAQDDDKRLALTSKYAMRLYNDGRFEEAEGFFEEMYRTRTRVHGEEHPSTLASMNNLASVYRDQGRWVDAEKLNVLVIEVAKKVLGEQHPMTLTCMNNLALLYSNEGRWKEAKELGTQVMETKIIVLGEEHPDTLTSMSNLAITYSNQCQWKEAVEIGMRVVEKRTKVLGEEHLDTLTSLNNLATTYSHQGRWSEAEQLETQVLEARKKVLGDEHMDTLVSMINLASTYDGQGRGQEAEELEVLAMHIAERTLGEAHHFTLACMNNLASTYRDHGRWKHAKELNVRVIESAKKVFGERHPNTLTSIDNLASLYCDQGQWKEAEQLVLRVIETRRKVLGVEHPSTLTSMARLASIYMNQGRWKEAEELGQRVMETSLRVLGEEHPDTLTSMANLASTFRRQGRWEEAAELGQRVMETRKRVHGEEHPDTLTSMNNLAFIWMGQGRNGEAIGLMSECLQWRTRVLGPSHPHTLSSSRTLADWRL